MSCIFFVCLAQLILVKCRGFRGNSRVVTSRWSLVLHLLPFSWDVANVSKAFDGWVHCSLGVESKLNNGNIVFRGSEIISQTHASSEINIFLISQTLLSLNFYFYLCIMVALNQILSLFVLFFIHLKRFSERLW